MRARRIHPGRILPVALGGVLGMSACARSNPAYEGGADGGGTGGADSGGGGTTTGVPDPDVGSDPEGGDGGTTTMPNGETTDPVGDGSGAPVGECGNGIVEGDEACDDDNDIVGDGCRPDCTRSGEPVWINEFSPNEGESVFRAVVLSGGYLVAAGRGSLELGSSAAAVVRYDIDDGTEIDASETPATWEASEYFALAAFGNAIYAAGRVRYSAGGGFVSHVTRFDHVGDGPLVAIAEADATGSTARGVATDGIDVILAVNRTDGEGYGIAGMTPDLNAGFEWLTPVGAIGILEDVAMVNGFAYVAGMIDDQAVVAMVTGPTETDLFPHFLMPQGGEGVDRFQALLPLPKGGFIAAGWRVQLGTQRDAWVTHVDPGGSASWMFVYDNGDMAVDEVEGMALDPAGNIIAAGMSGDPRKPAVWKLRVDDGTEIWQRSYPDLGDGEVFFRAVTVADDEHIYVVGENILEPDTNAEAIVLRLAP